MFDQSIVQSDAYSLVPYYCTANAQFQIEQLLEKQSEQLILESVEVDSLKSGVYRVWRDSQLLGTFHRDIANGLWISQARNYPVKPRFENSNDAVTFIVEMNAFATA